MGSQSISRPLIDLTFRPWLCPGLFWLLQLVFLQLQLIFVLPSFSLAASLTSAMIPWPLSSRSQALCSPCGPIRWPGLSAVEGQCSAAGGAPASPPLACSPSSCTPTKLHSETWLAGTYTQLHSFIARPQAHFILLECKCWPRFFLDSALSFCSACFFGLSSWLRIHSAFRSLLKCYCVLRTPSWGICGSQVGEAFLAPCALIAVICPPY